MKEKSIKLKVFLHRIPLLRIFTNKPPLILGPARSGGKLYQTKKSLVKLRANFHDNPHHPIQKSMIQTNEPFKQENPQLLKI